MTKSDKTANALVAIIIAVMLFTGALFSNYVHSLPTPQKGEISAINEKL